jgi:hypothetical protein
VTGGRLPKRVALASSVLYLGCAAQPGGPCAGPTCPDGLECSTNVCAPPLEAPVPEASDRIVVWPTRMAVVSRSSAAPHLPPIATLGARVDGETRWLVDFQPYPAELPRIERALLVLTASPSTGDDDIDLRVFTIHAPWDTLEVRYRSLPSFGRPEARGLARSRPPSPLRVDVTELVRHQALQAEAYGLVIVAEAGPGHGAQYFTGASGGEGPRLELYLAR